jgi:hypothetical protein
LSRDFTGHLIRCPRKSLRTRRERLSAVPRTYPPPPWSPRGRRRRRWKGRFWPANRGEWALRGRKRDKSAIVGTKRGFWGCCRRFFAFSDQRERQRGDRSWPSGGHTPAAGGISDCDHRPKPRPMRHVSHGWVFSPGNTRNAAHLSRTTLARVADLLPFLLYPPHGPTTTQSTHQMTRTAAKITRGVGRDAAVTPAGEGGRVRGVRRWETARTAGHADKNGMAGAGHSFCRFISPLGERKPIRRRSQRRRPRLKRGVLQELCSRNTMKMMKMRQMMHLRR